MDQLTPPTVPGGIPDRTPVSYHGKARVTQHCVVDGRPFLIAPGLAKRYTVCSDECKLARLQQPIPQKKRCTGPCGRTLPVNKFYVQGRNGRPFSRCKDCCADSQRDQIARKRIEDLEREPGDILDRTPAGHRTIKRVRKTCAAYLEDEGRVCGRPFLIAMSIAHKYSTCSSEHSKLKGVKPVGEMRICTGPCGLEKPIDQFYKQRHRGGRPTARCIECTLAATRDRDRDPAVRRAHTVSKSHYRRRMMLGLTKEEYAALRAVLRDHCAVCLATEKLCADHDHETGWFRDVLCQTDNRVIGLVGEDSARLRRLADYIDEHRARHAAATGKEDIYPEAEAPVPDGHRRCPRCRQPKPLEGFKGGYCNSCRTEYMRVYMRAKRMGITVKEYEKMHPRVAA